MEIDVRAEKRRLIEAFKHLEGFEGCGVGGGDRLVAVVKDEATAKALPAEFNGLPVEVLISGGIHPLCPPAG